MTFPAADASGNAIVLAGNTGAASVALQTDPSGNAKGGTTALGLASAAVSPASATTVFGPNVSAVGYQSMSGLALIQGATGGTLDVYIQTTFDGGTTWVDCVHFTQLAAAGAQVAWAFALRRGSAPAAPVAVNVASGTPSLAANTIAVGVLGTLVRYAFVAGAGTSAGAAQTIQAVFGQ